MQASLAEKESLVIVVTDSGLGGLWIAAELFERLRKSCSFKRVNVIFFNCLPSASFGFDSMESDDHRSRVLSNILAYIERHFCPDAVLLACNTISVIYDKTEFARQSAMPVIGIVQAGVDEIASFLRQQFLGQVILFSSLTTAQSGVHQRLLANNGFSSENLFYQVCHGLIAAIERGPKSDESRSLINRYVSESLKHFPFQQFPLAAVLLCTHFAYSSSVFYQAFIDRGIRLSALLDPNRRMVNNFMMNLQSNRFHETSAEIQVVSQVEIPDDRVNAISSELFLVSESAAVALQSAACTAGLFSTD